MSSCAKRIRKEKYKLLTKATKLEFQFFVHFADLHFQISYINAIILCVCACVYIYSVSNSAASLTPEYSLYFCGHINCLVKPCAHSFISG